MNLKDSLPGIPGSNSGSFKKELDEMKADKLEELKIDVDEVKNEENNNGFPLSPNAFYQLGLIIFLTHINHLMFLLRNKRKRQSRYTLPSLISINSIIQM